MPKKQLQKRIAACAEEYAEHVLSFADSQRLAAQPNDALFTVDRAGSQTSKRRIAKQVADRKSTSVNSIVSLTERKLVERAVARFGRIDVMFNNAGLGGAIGPITETSSEDWQRTFHVLLDGVFYGTKHAARQMIAAGQGGAIVNTASVGALIADPNMSVYCAMKHAVSGLTKAAAVEYAQKNIRVNAIAPGFVVTPMTQHWADDPNFRAAFFAGNVSGRAAQPEEIAGTVLHLLSGAASFINGATIAIDGGQTAH